MANEKVLDKVRALLTKAESTEHPEEAEALTAKATELMAKYGIDEAMAAVRKKTKETPGDEKIFIDAPYHKPKTHLINAIAHAFRCDLIQLAHPNMRRGSFVHVFGFESDLELVQTLYTSLLLQMANAAKHQRGWQAGDTRSARSAFMYGFVAGVNEQLAAANKAAKKEAEPGTALVLADRSLAVKKAFEDAYPSVRTSSRARITNGRAYEQGKSEGRNANLHNRPGVSNTRGALT